LNRDVGSGLFKALFNASDRVPHIQTQIPAGPDEGFELGLGIVFKRLVDQNQQIKVRAREELTPTITAHSDKAGTSWEICTPPQGDQAFIGVGCKPLQ